MKALTLTQPWATLIAIGAKRIETRSWGTDYRGPLAIHAAKGLGPVGGKRGLAELCGTQPFFSVLDRQCTAFYLDGWEALPLGKIIATVDLVDVQRIGTIIRERVISQTVTPHEIDFGDYTSGRYAWLLRNVKRLERPIECKGALSLWDVPQEIQMQLHGITEQDVYETRSPTLWPA